MQSPFLFLALSTGIALASMGVNYRITREKIRADQAFWLAWLFLIWSAEIVTAFPSFEYHFRYPVQPETRNLTIVTFIAAAVGFLIGSVLHLKAREESKARLAVALTSSLPKRWMLWAALGIFIVGLFEFRFNEAKFSSLLELRVAAVEGELATGTFYTQFFYFAQAWVMLLGFSDGAVAKVSRVAVALSIGGLVLHNLSIGGRINVIVAPALYLIPFILMARQRKDWDGVVRARVIRFVISLGVVIALAFPLISLFRTNAVDLTRVATFGGFFKTVIFSLPMYVSETFISISVHAHHARTSDVPFGYYTFDAFYRLFGSDFSSNIQGAGSVFGHDRYRATPAPWAWTQTNMIPRLIADFGSLFWLALIPISALVQWLSLHRTRVGFLSVVIRSLMIFSSAYTILSAPRFTAFNVYILFYSALIYYMSTMASRHPQRGASGRSPRRVKR